MARPKYAKTTGVSLKALAKEFGIGAKLDLEATNTKGKYLKDFTPEELDAMSEYNKVDTELCAALFKRLVNPPKRCGQRKVARRWARGHPQARRALQAKLKVGLSRSMCGNSALSTR